MVIFGGKYYGKVVYFGEVWWLCGEVFILGRSAVVLRGSVVNFAGKWCISGGSRL